MTKVELYKSRPFVTSVHFIALVQYLFAMFYFHFHVNIPKDSGFTKGLGGKAAYLTYWCLTMQMAWYGLIRTILGPSTNAPKMRLSLSCRVSFKMLTRIYFLVVIYALSSKNLGNAIKTWRVNEPEFMKPDNWVEGFPPCAFDKILFPEEYSTIFLPAALDTAGLILPKEGALLIHPNSEINFGAERKKDQVCKYRSRQAWMMPGITKSWFDPANWHHVGNNSATPHFERIPCFNDEVVIDHVGSLSIDLENAEYLYMGGLVLDGDNLPLSIFERFLKTELGQIMFKNSDETLVRFHDEPTCGCHHFESTTEIQWKVCNYEKLTCEVPHCVNPVVPTGHCCPICASILMLHVNDVSACKGFKVDLLKTRVKAQIALSNFNDELDFHVSMVDQGFEQYAQLVIMDKNGYNEKSTQFMKILNDTLLTISYRQFKQTFHSSGMSYSPGSGASVWVFIFVTLLAVVVFFAVMFAHFVPENPYISIPPWMYPSRYRIAGSPFVFARFENAQPEVEAEQARGNVVMNVTYEEGETGRSEGGTTSFDNPMFSENGETEKMQADVAEDPAMPEEQEMTNISLEATT